MKNQKRTGLTIAGAALCLALVVIWQTGILDRNPVSAATGNLNPGEGDKTVGVVHPRPVTDGHLIEFPGRARAAVRATLFFRVSAPLAHVHAEPGQRVEKGALLLELDDRDFRRQVQVMESRLKSAKATLLKLRTGARPEDVKIIESSLAAARADLALAEKELERHEILYQNQAVSEQSYDRAKTNVQSLGAKVASLEEQLVRDTKGARKEDLMAARANVAELEARLGIARDQLSDTRLVAPFSGVVTQRFIDAHEMVGQGKPVMTLDDITRLEIPVDVPETQVRTLLKTSGTGAEPRYEALVLTQGEKVYPATLTQYASRADQATGTYEFVFSITPAPDDLVFPGMTARIRLKADTPVSLGMAVPLSSLMGVAGNSAHIFKVDPESRTVFRQPVSFETLSGGSEVRVKSGLKPGDLVVADGAAFVRQGQKVNYELDESQRITR